jgi:hypothetical protein
MMDPRISKPPDEPPARKLKPQPIPTSTPPNTEESSISVATKYSGMIVKNQVVAKTDNMLSIINLRPSWNQPATSNGILKRKYKRLMFSGVK